jgi:hypothetical protein
MRVFRAFSHEVNNSLKFVKQEDLPYMDELESKLFDYFFKRTLITKDRETRFGIEGNPALLYFCEDKLTTYYEYGYWLLKTPKILAKGVKVSLISCELSHEDSALIINIETLDVNLKNKIMDINDKSYIGAHAWIKNMSPRPDLIIYNSIRYTAGDGRNFAHIRGHIDDISFVEFETAILNNQQENTLDLLKSKRKITPQM